LSNFSGLFASSGTTFFTMISVSCDPLGNVLRVEVVSSSANRFVEQVCARVIRSIKFPRVPKKVLAETGHEFVAIQTEIKIGE
jgi:outer membrane biosynthesis protein TonB